MGQETRPWVDAGLDHGKAMVPAPHGEGALVDYPSTLYEYAMPDPGAATGESQMAKPIPKPIRSRRATRAVLPHSTENLKLLNPSNEDIIKVIDEIKPNQQKLLDEYNKLKQHVLFIDRICLKLFIDALAAAQLPLPILGPVTEPESFQLGYYHSLPPL